MTVLRRAALATTALVLVIGGPAAAQAQTPAQDYPAPIEVLPTTIERAPDPEPAPQPAPEVAAGQLPRTGADAGMLAAAGIGALAVGASVLRRRRS